jgi:hypothetical protein
MVHCLGNKNTIKWVAVMEGKRKVYFQVFESDGKLDDACCGEVGFDRVERENEGEFANVGFDSNFPERDDTDKDGGGGFNLSAGGGWKSSIVFEKPDEGMGVEEISHGYM